MATFRLTLDAVLSENTDLTDPEFTLNWANYTTSPTTSKLVTLVTNSAFAQVVSLDDLALAGVSTVLAAFQNTDTTNSINVTWESSKIETLTPGSIMVLPQVSTGTNITVQSAAGTPEVKILIAG